MDEREKWEWRKGRPGSSQVWVKNNGLGVPGVVDAAYLADGEEWAPVATPEEVVGLTDQIAALTESMLAQAEEISRLRGAVRLALSYVPPVFPAVLEDLKEVLNGDA